MPDGSRAHPPSHLTKQPISFANFHHRNRKPCSDVALHGEYISPLGLKHVLVVDGDVFFDNATATDN